MIRSQAKKHRMHAHIRRNNFKGFVFKDFCCWALKNKEFLIFFNFKRGEIRIFFAPYFRKKWLLYLGEENSYFILKTLVKKLK